MPIMFCSAMPTWKKRSGKAWANGATSVYLDRSAEITTTSGRSRPTSTIAAAKGALTSGAEATGRTCVAALALMSGISQAPFCLSLRGGSDGSSLRGGSDGHAAAVFEAGLQRGAEPGQAGQVS